ncbi:MAG: hypothetical protein JNL57_05235 [Bacteroidetes bacterium]|nr:hypothetical protein [Bacteroidota bacterium]
MRWKVAIAGLLYCSGANAQVPENLYFGVYGRQENNLYRYYSGNTLGTYYTTRTSQGYSAGLAIHSSINYLFNACLGFGLSEAHYSPALSKGNSQLYQASLRLWHLNLQGELKLGQEEKHQPVFQAGGQWIFKESGREIFSNGDIEEFKWPQTRFMPQLGVGWNFVLKNKWVVKPNLGIRINTKNKVGYDYSANQIFFGCTAVYRVKSW